MRFIIRLIAVILLIGGAIGAGTNLNRLYTPSDEEKLYQKYSGDAEAKIKIAEDTKGKPDEIKKTADAKSAIQIAEIWRDGMEQRQNNYKFYMTVSGGVAIVGLIIFLATVFIGRKEIP